jgi:deoxyribodipyrimidine photo-lyase
MLQSLRELADAYKGLGTRLHFYYGSTVDVLKKIPGVGALFQTADYTPYAKKRTAEIQKWAHSAAIHYEPVHDLYLNAPGSILNKGGRPYQKFTPYYNAALKKHVEKPGGIARGPYVSSRASALHTGASVSLDAAVPADRLAGSEGRAYVGGRAEGLELLKKIPRNYEAIHDMLAEKTSGLSVHHHYGTIGVRESYAACENVAFRRQLYWRDFYGQIVAFFEELYGVGAYEFQTGARYESLSAEKARILKAWKAGRTGVPLVDAGMRQMNETGFMHNRARLAVASWLVKDMGIWWRWGERYFAERLLDYDFTQNFGNWCWVASVLPFSQAPFRRHDPTRIAERLDPDGVYVERWLGEEGGRK